MDTDELSFHLYIFTKKHYFKKNYDYKLLGKQVRYSESALNLIAY
jgi:hypothetical protein